MSHQATSRYRKTLQDLKSMIKDFHRHAHNSDIRLTAIYGCGNLTIKRLRYMLEHGCSAEEAIEGVPTKPSVSKFNPNKNKDPADAYMHRPDGVNWLTRSWK